MTRPPMVDGQTELGVFDFRVEFVGIPGVVTVSCAATVFPWARNSWLPLVANQSVTGAGKAGRSASCVSMLV